MAEPVVPPCGECERLKETVRRLNRRCQKAEAAANLKVEQWGQRSKHHGRAYVFELGRRTVFADARDRENLHRWVVDALRKYVAAHGSSLEGSGIGSAAKRVAAEICARQGDEGDGDVELQSDVEIIPNL